MKDLTNRYVVIKRLRDRDQFSGHPFECIGACDEVGAIHEAERLARYDDGTHEYLACKVISVSSKPPETITITVRVGH